MSRRYLSYLACLCFSFSDAAFPEEHVWLIAGGPSPSNSQAQIEHNVSWVLQSLNRMPKDYKTHLYFTHGGKDSKDIVEWVEEDSSNDEFYVWSRIFSDYSKSSERYRKNRLDNIDSSTQKADLLANLPKEFSALSADDRAVIIYNGHGLKGKSDAGDNTLRLWGNEQITAREFESLLGKFDPQVPVQLIFTQCYSGGFSRLVYKDGAGVLNLASGFRCGFFAESKDEKAEGCSASIKTSDYRDYTTYLFAALSGKDRRGNPIKNNVDLDHDGVVSLYDAHLYSLLYAYNSDLPRSTSEVFLEKWLPWYLRWLPVTDSKPSVYAELLEALRIRMHLPSKTDDMLREIANQKNKLRIMRRELKDEQDENRKLIHEIQKKIQNDVYMRWPEARLEHTGHYLEFMKSKVFEAQKFISAHKAFAELLKLQRRQSTIENIELLKVERDMTQLNKLLRIRNIQRIHSLFQKYAGDQEKNWYAQLKRCETISF